MEIENLVRFLNDHAPSSSNPLIKDLFNQENFFKYGRKRTTEVYTKATNKLSEDLQKNIQSYIGKN